MVSLIPSLGIVFTMRWYPCYQSPFITFFNVFPYFFVKKFVGYGIFVYLCSMLVCAI